MSGVEVTYRDFELTGEQDCGNTFDLDDFELDAGDIEAVLASGVMDEDVWIEQQDDFEHLDPHRCFEHWRTGYLACARPYVLRALDDRKAGLKLYYVTDAYTVDPADLPKPPGMEEVSSEFIIEQFDALDEAVVVLARIPQGRILMGDALNGPDDVILWVVKGNGHLDAPWYFRDVAGVNDREYGRLRVLFSTTRAQLEARGCR